MFGLCLQDVFRTVSMELGVMVHHHGQEPDCHAFKKNWDAIFMVKDTVRACIKLN